MCGVCGIVRWDGGEPDLSRVLEMRSVLEHRGPDDTGVAVHGKAALGATRLAIRGVSEGHQPLRDPKTGVVVVCNGEIDNHEALRRWLRARGHEVSSESDVAILPFLYAERGDRFVDELEGPFAIALWDPREDKLVLARDRVGERPLFYAERNGQVVFATELSAISVHPETRTSLDPEAIRHYIRFGRFPSPLTPLTGVRKVAPSEVLCFSPRGKTSQRYWRWGLGTVRTAEPSIDRFDRIFREAVRRQTACDADYGVFLSGGVDSSLVAAVAKSLRTDSELTAYTLRFDEASYDEGTDAARVAERLGLAHETVWVRAEDFPARIRELVRLTGEPLGDPAWVPTALLAQRAVRDVKMVLVGEGGDEVFGGYPTYPGALLARGYERLPSPIRGAVSTLVRRWPPTDRKVTLSYLLKRFVDGSGMEPLVRHLLWMSVTPPKILERIGCPPVADLDVDATGGDVLDDLQRHDLETYLAEGLLTKADRASMGWALEPRAPFLDREVLEFAATLPPRERVRGLRTKAFLKRYALRYLPRKVVYRRKQGLSVPLGSWLRGPLHDWARERLGSGLLEVGGVQTPAVMDLFEEHLLRRADWARALWTFLVLAEWLEWWAQGDVEVQTARFNLNLQRTSAGLGGNG